MHHQANAHRLRIRLEGLEERITPTAEAEPNNTLATATVAVLPNDTLTGGTGSSSDIDHFRLNLAQGDTLRIRYGDIDRDGHPAFGPSMELLDAGGTIVAGSYDGHLFTHTIASAGAYYLRLTPPNVFGVFNGTYSITTAVTAFSGVTESETNDTPAAADSLGSSVTNFRGSLASTSDIDVFSFSGTANQAVTIKWAGLLATNPSVRLTSPTATLLATDLTGTGLHWLLPQTGTYTLAVRSDNSNGPATGEYVGQLLFASNPLLEATVEDSFANAPVINLGPSVISSAYLATDNTFTTQGLTGSYVNQSMRAVTPTQDWRSTSGLVAGTRIDPMIHFAQDGWGTRSTVNLTGGNDNNWDAFAVQWDGWLRVVTPNTRLYLATDDGSRMWIDLNADNVFNASGTEFINNNWGGTQGTTLSAASVALSPGDYRIRIQYDEGSGGNNAFLVWDDKSRSTGNVPLGRSQQAVGTLSSLNDVDVYALDMSATSFYNFQLTTTTGAQSIQNRVLSLYNQFGQLLEYSTRGFFTTESEHTRPETNTRYYLVVQATNATGLGGYSLSVNNYREFPQYRDIPLFYHNYSGYDLPSQIPEFVAFFDARFDPYQVDTVTTAPASGTEHISWTFSGVGSQTGGGWGASGSAGGSFGTRRPSGSGSGSVTGDWTFFQNVWHGLYYHEVAHSVGMYHSFNPLSVMSSGYYGGQSDIFPVGSFFDAAVNGDDGDRRLAAIKVQNERDYMDWALEAGRILPEAESNDTLATAQQLQHFIAMMSADGDARTDQAVVTGIISSPTDVDVYRISAVAAELWSFDVDAAEFQYPLDARLEILDSSGTVLATNLGGRDLDTGITSVDPNITYRFATAGDYYVRLTSEYDTIGSYRFKVTPERALDTVGPKIAAAWPNGTLTAINGTSQLTFWMNDQLDPATLTASNIVVQGQSTGVRAGTAFFDPIDATLTWRANVQLPVDTYTVTLRSGATGIKDLRGNQIDGETGGDNLLTWPEVSGNGTAGGDFVSRFVVNATDTTTASIYSSQFARQAHERGMFTLYFNDELDAASVYGATFTLRGAGTDRAFSTADDTFTPVDVLYDRISGTTNANIRLLTRGQPDPDSYRVEATFLDAAGRTVNVSQVINVTVDVPQGYLFTNATATNPGLTGNYVNQSLRSYATQDNWAQSQTIAGTRVDPQVAFNSNSLGVRSTVGITGGTDDNWDNFSVQWDGYIVIPTNGVRLYTRSDDGSRMWIDINNDGTYNPSGNEFINNGWGNGQGTTLSAASVALNAGTYRIRMQYEEGTGGNSMALVWDFGGTGSLLDDFASNLKVVDVNVQPNTVVTASPATIDVRFSNSVNTATLTTSTFRVRYSPDPTFFDANDTFISELNNAISWNASTRTARFQPSSTLTSGYYLVELQGTTGGIQSTSGRLLDGEFLNGFIAGYTPLNGWQDSPSGNGQPGGDYRANFSIRLADVRGTQINDLDGDGVRDAGEPGLANWTIYSDTNDNGSLDSGELSTTTDANGNYTLPNLAPGNHRIRSVLQAGWLATIPSGGSYVITVTGGETIVGRDFAATSNSAPELDNSGEMALTTIMEDATTNSGTLIEDIIASAGENRITDADLGALEGIAIIAANTANGTWQFSLDNGGAWSALGSVSNTSARLLAADGNTRLRFVPSLDFNGSVSAGVTFHAWDRTYDTSGTLANISTNGGVSAYSTATETASIAVTAVNDAPSFTKGSNITVLEDSGAATFSGWANSISPGPADENGQTVNFVVTTDNDALFDVVPQLSSTGTLTFTPKANAFGVVTVTVRLRDNGLTTNGGSDTSAPQILTLTLDPVNDEPAFNKGSNDTVGEDFGLRTVNNWATGISHGPANESGQTLDFLLTTDNDALFQQLPDVSDTGVLTYMPANDANGSATITIRLKDNGTTANNGVDTTASQTFVITVNPVNDRPSFTKGLDEEVGEDAGSRTVPNWATNISVGPLDEAGQTRTFDLTTDNDALFLVKPSLSLTGELTYTLVPNALGQATVTITLSDNGGGTNTSLPQTFTITANATNDAPELDNGGEMALTTIAEDATTNSGTRITTLLASASGDRITDPDPGAVEGIAIVAADTANGSWQFSLNDGAAWSNVGAVSDANARLLAADTTTRVRFVPNPDYFGTLTTAITFRAWDRSSGTNGSLANSSVNGNQTPFSSDIETASLHVTAVNDPPRFTMSNRYDIEEDVGPQSLAWATGIEAGAANESSQTLTFLVSTNNDGLFATLPQISATGQLTYTPKNNASGEAIVTVQLMDSGDGLNVSAPQAFTIAITAINDSPTLNTGTYELGPIPRNTTTHPGFALTDALTVMNVQDVDVNSSLGLAVIGQTGNGTWDYSLDNGATWQTLAGVSPATARLLDGSTRVRFIPVNGFKGTASLTVHVWDQTTGTLGGQINTTTGVGGATAFSNLSAVLDVPVVTTLTPVAEDNTRNKGDALSSFVNPFIADADLNAKRGIALIGLTGTDNGAWQYSVNKGRSWKTITTVSKDRALLLRDTDRLRYVPTLNYHGFASIRYHAWDQTTGTVGQLVNLTLPNAVGGSTPFSTATDLAYVIVNAVNDPPVLNIADNPRFTPIIPSNLNPAGDLVRTILGPSATDIEGHSLGMAVVGVTGKGRWQYQLANTTQWLELGKPTNNTARLLLPVDRLRFVPDFDFLGQATLKYRAWDMTAGTAHQIFKIGTNTAFSKLTESASLLVSFEALPTTNQAPVFDVGGTSALPTVNEDAKPVGTRINSLLGTRITDGDTGALEGIAITNITGANGTWQYSVNGRQWLPITAVSPSRALLLRDTDFIRFLPSANKSGSASFTYHAWDRSRGSVGARADLTLGMGGSTAFSTASWTTTIDVLPVNDAPLLNTKLSPTLSPVLPTNDDPDGDTLARLLIGATDVDGDALSIVITGATGQGTWQYRVNGAGPWLDVGTVMPRILGVADRIRFVPLASGTAKLLYQAWDGTTVSKAIESATILVNATNEAPTFPRGVVPTLTPIATNTVEPTGDLVALLVSQASDTDPNALLGIAIVGVTTIGGRWEIMTNGSSWDPLGVVGKKTPQRLLPTDRIRFVPTTGFTGVVSLTYQIWDSASANPLAANALSKTTVTAKLAINTSPDVLL